MSSKFIYDSENCLQNSSGTHLSLFTRPDITYAVNFLSQFNNNPGYQHWITAKRVLRYLKGTTNYGIKYKRTEKPLICCVNAD